MNNRALCESRSKGQDSRIYTPEAGIHGWIIYKEIKIIKVSGIKVSDIYRKVQITQRSLYQTKQSRALFNFNDCLRSCRQI